MVCQQLTGNKLSAELLLLMMVILIISSCKIIANSTLLLLAVKLPHVRMELLALRIVAVKLSSLHGLVVKLFFLSEPL